MVDHLLGVTNNNQVASCLHWWTVIQATEIWLDMLDTCEVLCLATRFLTDQWVGLLLLLMKECTLNNNQHLHVNQQSWFGSFHRKVKAIPTKDQMQSNQQQTLQMVKGLGYQPCALTGYTQKPPHTRIENAREGERQEMVVSGFSLIPKPKEGFV